MSDKNECTFVCWMIYFWLALAAAVAMFAISKVLSPVPVPDLTKDWPPRDESQVTLQSYSRATLRKMKPSARKQIVHCTDCDATVVCVGDRVYGRTEDLEWRAIDGRKCE